MDLGLLLAAVALGAFGVTVSSIPNDPLLGWYISLSWVFVAVAGARCVLSRQWDLADRGVRKRIANTLLVAAATIGFMYVSALRRNSASVIIRDHFPNIDMTYITEIRSELRRFPDPTSALVLMEISAADLIQVFRDSRFCAATKGYSYMDGKISRVEIDSTIVYNEHDTIVRGIAVSFTLKSRLDSSESRPEKPLLNSRVTEFRLKPPYPTWWSPPAVNKVYAGDGYYVVSGAGSEVYVILLE